MTVLIKQARIIDPSSPYNETKQDILVESGFIKNIGNQLNTSEGETFSADDLHVSPGWVDVFANFADPGYEFRETLESGSNAAAAGGFTDVFVIPNVKPVTDNKSQVEYLSRKSGSLAANIHPIGAVSKNADGK